MASEMASIFDKLNLENFTERFNSEKRTPDLLGMQSRSNIMALRMECSKHGSNRPPRSARNECVNVALLCSKSHGLFWSAILNKI